MIRDIISDLIKSKIQSLNTPNEPNNTLFISRKRHTSQVCYYYCYAAEIN